jgi:hypothetical protein
VLHIAQSLRASGLAPSVEAAANRLLGQIREIRDQFEGLDRLLQTIDVRHSQFVDSAVRTVELQLTASTTTSGQLHAILTHMLTGDDDALDTDIADAIDLYALSLLDTESLAAPSRAAVPFVPEPVVAPPPTPEEIAAAQARTLEQLNRSISRERVRRYAAELLRDQNEVRIGLLALEGPGSLPLLIYLRQYGDGSLGYRAEDAADDWVERDGVGFRDFVIKKP